MIASLKDLLVPIPDCQISEARPSTQLVSSQETFSVEIPRRLKRSPLHFPETTNPQPIATLMSMNINLNVESHIQHSNRILKELNNNSPTFYPGAARKLIYQYESAIKNLQRLIPATETKRQYYHNCDCLQEHPRELRLFIDNHPKVKAACRKYAEGRRLCTKCDFLVFLGPEHDARCEPQPKKKNSLWAVPNTPADKAAAAIYNAIWSQPKGKEPVRSNSPPAAWETQRETIVTFQDPLPTPEADTTPKDRPLTRQEKRKARLTPEEYLRHETSPGWACYDSDCDTHRSCRNYYGRN